ncbi:hypothetical protein C8Q74DRAFT_1372490 [Fomes fomentarius]|nr:hypothetical protein C8Q74DRAFT_1372490 [Fomes fomentarius]
MSTLGQVFIVVYQYEASLPGLWSRNDEAYTRLWFVLDFDLVVQGTLIHLIGIYPTLIIILVTLDMSHCETTFSYAINAQNSDPGLRVISFAAASRRQPGGITTDSLSQRSSCITSLGYGNTFQGS